MSTAPVKTAALAPPAPGNVCAVLVTFHPDAELPARFAALAELVGRIIVVDNGSSPETRAMLEGLERAHGAVTLLNPENVGIAAALNRGLVRAREEGFIWAVTMDQDSQVLPGFLEALCRALAACPLRESVALVGSIYLYAGMVREARSQPAAQTRAYAERRTAITSGSLMSLRAYAEVGPFREEFFIDAVDEEYCLRARRRGFTIICASEPGMVHSLGAVREHRWLGLRLLASHHSELRRYYMTRNTLRVMAEYGGREPGWVLRTLLRVSREWLGLLLFEGERGRKARAGWHGLVDAFYGRMGPRPSPCPDRKHEEISR